MRTFEEYEEGSRERFGNYKVAREEALDFAAKYDPQPFHLDDEAARANPIFGKLAASGLLASPAATLAGLAALPAVYPPGLGAAYWVGVAGCAVLLAYQHAIVRPGDLSRLNAAFFTANGVLAVGLFAAVLADRLM